MEVPSGADADTERFVLYGCVTDLLARVSEVQPVLVVLDDLHWADRATVQLLRHVATAEQPMRVGCSGRSATPRSVPEHPVSELLAALHREGGALRIVLRGLTDLTCSRCWRRIAGHEMTDDGVALARRAVGRDGREPVLRRGDPAPPRRDRRDLSG